MSTTILDLDKLELLHGCHKEREKGVCLMEAVAWFANEPHSDRPACACPVLTSFGIGLNDRFKPEERQRLKEFIPLLVGTRSTREVELKRGFFLADKAVRVFAPMALRATKNPTLIEHAEKLEALPEVTSAAAAAAAAWRAAAAAAWRAAAAAAAAAWRAAAAAAWRADAAADAAAAAAAAAAWRADAAADAAAASPSRQLVVDKAVEIFRQAIAIQ